MTLDPIAAILASAGLHLADGDYGLQYNLVVASISSLGPRVGMTPEVLSALRDDRSDLFTEEARSKQAADFVSALLGILTRADSRRSHQVCLTTSQREGR